MTKTTLNNHRTELWKADVTASIDFYNNWFMHFAPQTYIAERNEATKKVEEALKITNDLQSITSKVLQEHPSLLHILRMLTAPPIARDRLAGLAYITKNNVETFEEGKLPRMDETQLATLLERIVDVISQLLDRNLFEWIDAERVPSHAERKRVASVIADRLCGADANPIIRNEQERRQIQALSDYLNKKGYHQIASKSVKDFREMKAGTYCDHLIVLVEDNGGRRQKRIPVDMVVKPLQSEAYDLPILIECKSAGDSTNTNKRQKEEAQKMNQLRDTYGNHLRYLLFLCGYFDTPFQGYVASEGIDWVWEHRINDLDILLK